MKRFFAWLSAIRGYCPECNCDAPKTDSCEVCGNYRHKGEFPPDWVQKAAWIMNWEVLHEAANRKDS